MDLREFRRSRMPFTLRNNTQRATSNSRTRSNRLIVVTIARLAVKAPASTNDISRYIVFWRAKASSPASSSSITISPTHASSPLFSLPGSRGRLGRGNGPRCSLIMNHRRHLPLFIVVRARLIYRHDSRAYYSRFLPRRLRIYYSAAGFRLALYRRALVSFVSR